MHLDNWGLKAKELGYRSRAVFKLEEILISDLEQKFSKSKKNMWIIYPYN